MHSERYTLGWKIYPWAKRSRSLLSMCWFTGTLLAHSEAAETKSNAIMVNHNVKI